MRSAHIITVAARTPTAIPAAVLEETWAFSCFSGVVVGAIDGGIADERVDEVVRSAKCEASEVVKGCCDSTSCEEVRAKVGLGGDPKLDMGTTYVVIGKLISLDSVENFGVNAKIDIVTRLSNLLPYFGGA